jgi:hypothetical protein
LWGGFIQSEEGLVDAIVPLKPLTPGLSLSSLKAAYFFSTIRMLSPVKAGIDLEQRLLYIESLYPYLDEEKREAVQMMLDIALVRRDIPRIEQYILLAKEDEIYIAHWQYIPALLRSGENFSDILSQMLKTYGPKNIPEVILQFLRIRQESLPESQYLNFLISYSMIPNLGHMSAILKEAQTHFRNIEYIFRSTHSHIISEETAKGLSAYFESLGYTITATMELPDGIL